MPEGLLDQCLSRKFCPPKAKIADQLALEVPKILKVPDGTWVAFVLTDETETYAGMDDLVRVDDPARSDGCCDRLPRRSLAEGD